MKRLFYVVLSIVVASVCGLEGMKRERVENYHNCESGEQKPFSSPFLCSVLKVHASAVTSVIFSGVHMFSGSSKGGIVEIDLSNKAKRTLKDANECGRSIVSQGSIDFLTLSRDKKKLIAFAVVDADFCGSLGEQKDINLETLTLSTSPLFFADIFLLYDNKCYHKQLTNKCVSYFDCENSNADFGRFTDDECQYCKNIFSYKQNQILFFDKERLRVFDPRQCVIKKTIKLFSNAESLKYKKLCDTCFCSAFDRKRKALLVGCKNGGIYEFDLKQKKWSLLWQKEGMLIDKLLCDEKEQKILFSFYDSGKNGSTFNALVVYDLKREKAIEIFHCESGLEKGISFISFVPDERIVVGLKSGEIVFIDYEMAKIQKKLSRILNKNLLTDAKLDFYFE